MHLDNQNLLSDRQAITTSAATTNFINLGARDTPSRSTTPLSGDLGAGSMIPFLCQVVEDFAGATSVEFRLEVDDNPSFSSPKSAGSSGVIPVARLKAGFILPISTMPLGTDERYLRGYFTVAGTATAGRITAGVVAGVQTNG